MQPIPYTLAPLGECALEMLFTPGAVGTRLANLVIVDSAPGSPQTVTMEGAGLPSSVSLSFTTSPADFGLAPLGQTPFDYVYLENAGTTAADVSLQIQGMDAGDFSETGYCSFVPPESSCFIPVYFTPSALGLRVATLVATDSVSGQSVSVVLIGSGVPSGLPVSVSVPEFSAVVVGNSTDGNFSLTNVGASPFTITQFALTGGAKSDFSILVNSCSVGAVLNPFTECTATVTFTPSGTGTRVADIDIGYSGGSSTLSVPLAAVGLAVSRVITFNSTAIELGAEPLGEAVGGSVSIANTGSEAVSFAGLSIAGPAAQDFAITGNQCPHPPATLAAGTSCQVTVQFTPSALGPRLARLQLSDNAAGSPQSLPMVGFGVNGAPAIQIQPDALSFFSEPLGSSTQFDVSLYSVSGAAISLSGFKILGPNAGDFTLVNDCPATLTTACEVYVTFTPSVTGLRVAELQISDNATGSPQVIPLAGVGMTVPPPAGAISLAPNPLAFALAQGVGYTTSAAINVTNTGTVSVVLSKFKIGGKAAKDFGIQSNACPLSPASLAQNQSCTVTIEFTPSATGVRLATFTLTDNASGSP
jgi:trimeric autotransporter adhesin